MHLHRQQVLDSGAGQQLPEHHCNLCTPVSHTAHAVDVSLTQPDVYRLKTPENEAHGVQIIPNYRYKLLLTIIMITRRALGRAHVPPTKRCSNGLVNKKLS